MACCPNCQNECSEAAVACPECGHPLKHVEMHPHIMGTINWRMVQQAVGAGFALFGFFMLMGMLGRKPALPFWLALAFLFLGLTIFGYATGKHIAGK